MPVAVISIYHGGGGSLVQDMDSLDTEGLDAQLLVCLLYTSAADRMLHRNPYIRAELHYGECGG